MDLLGERLTSVTRRLHTPTSDEWRSGEYVDAGLAMIVSHNLAHKQRESLRQIATALGPGTITNSVRGYTFQGVPLEDTHDDGIYTGVRAISWDEQTARHFGPVFLIADRDVTDQPPTWRSIRVNLDVTAGGMDLFACVTNAGVLPSEGAFLAFDSATSSAGRTFVALDLGLSRANLVAVPQRCRRSTGSSVESSACAAVSLWVGWYGTGGTNSVWTISAYEVR